MNIKVLQKLLNPNKREILYLEILSKLKECSQLPFVNYKERDTFEGTIPFILLKNPEEKEIKQVKVFVGAQHNEYNGLFGIIKFLNLLNAQKLKKYLQNQILLFFPLMNPYGFLNPREDNKSGYYLKNGTNLNRY